MAAGSEEMKTSIFIEDVTDALGEGAPESDPVLWSELKAEGSIPPARGGHSATLLGNRIFVWGGADRQQQYQPAVHALNLSTNRWEEVEVKGLAPDPRSGHSAVAWGDDAIVVYGGMSTVLEKFFGDCWLLQVKEVEGAAVTSASWSEPEACGVPALQRNSHTATMVTAGPKSGCMIVIGGGCQDGLKLSVQVADLNELPARVTWSTVENASLPKIGGREMHGACAVANKLLVFGGRTGPGGETVSDELITVDVDSMQVLAVDKIGEARCGHAMAVSRGEGGQSCVLVTGGIDMTGPFAYDDLIRFELVSQRATVEEEAGSAAGGKKSHAAEALELSWSKHKPEDGESSGAVARFAHSATAGGGKLYVFGGIDFESDYSSVAVCSVPSSS